jgi:hypothetical protein
LSLLRLLDQCDGLLHVEDGDVAEVLHAVETMTALAWCEIRLVLGLRIPRHAGQ